MFVTYDVFMVRMCAYMYACMHAYNYVGMYVCVSVYICLWRPGGICATLAILLSKANIGSESLT